MPGKKSITKEKAKIAAFLTDIHIPYHDEEALGVILESILSADVDTVVIGGDVADFYKISSWKTDPNRMPFVDELEMVRSAISGMARKFAKKQVVFIEGNHEERMQRYLWTNAKELAGLHELILPKLLRLDKHGWEYVNNKNRMMKGLGPYKMGKLFVLHGHEIRMGWGAINLAKIYYDRCRTNVIVGHHHRAQEWIVRLLSGKHEGCWLVGFAGELSPEYMPHNDWVHGFALIHRYADGNFRVENKKVIKGKVL